MIMRIINLQKKSKKKTENIIIWFFNPLSAGK